MGFGSFFTSFANSFVQFYGAAMQRNWARADAEEARLKTLAAQQEQRAHDAEQADLDRKAADRRAIEQSLYPTINLMAQRGMYVDAVKVAVAGADVMQDQTALAALEKAGADFARMLAENREEEKWLARVTAGRDTKGYGDTIIQSTHLLRTTDTNYYKLDDSGQVDEQGEPVMQWVPRTDIPNAEQQSLQAWLPRLNLELDAHGKLTEEQKQNIRDRFMFQSAAPFQNVVVPETDEPAEKGAVGEVWDTAVDAVNSLANQGIHMVRKHMPGIAGTGPTGTEPTPTPPRAHPTPDQPPPGRPGTLGPWGPSPRGPDGLDWDLSAVEAPAPAAGSLESISDRIIGGTGSGAARSTPRPAAPARPLDIPGAARGTPPLSSLGAELDRLDPFAPAGDGALAGETSPYPVTSRQADRLDTREFNRTVGQRAPQIPALYPGTSQQQDGSQSVRRAALEGSPVAPSAPDIAAEAARPLEQSRIDDLLTSGYARGGTGPSFRGQPAPAPGVDHAAQADREMRVDSLLRRLDATDTSPARADFRLDEPTPAAAAPIPEAASLPAPQPPARPAPALQPGQSVTAPVAPAMGSIDELAQEAERRAQTPQVARGTTQGAPATVPATPTPTLAPMGAQALPRVTLPPRRSDPLEAIFGPLPGTTAARQQQREADEAVALEQPGQPGRERRAPARQSPGLTLVQPDEEGEEEPEQQLQVAAMGSERPDQWTPPPPRDAVPPGATGRAGPRDATPPSVTMPGAPRDAVYPSPTGLAPPRDAPVGTTTTTAPRDAPPRSVDGLLNMVERGQEQTRPVVRTAPQMPFLQPPSPPFGPDIPSPLDASRDLVEGVRDALRPRTASIGEVPPVRRSVDFDEAGNRWRTSPIGEVPRQEGDVKTHTVSPGETLSQLARRYNTSVQALARANDIQNPDLIFPGQSLSIPGPGPEIQPPRDRAALQDTATQEAMDLIRRYEIPGGKLEERWLKPYLDYAGFPTIGIGHLLEKKQYANEAEANLGRWKTLTMREAEDLYRKDVEERLVPIMEAFPEVNDPRLIAMLTSLSFNIGQGDPGVRGGLFGTAAQHLRDLVERNASVDEIRQEFLTFNQVAGKLDPNILARRQHEINFWLGGR